MRSKIKLFSLLLLFVNLNFYMSYALEASLCINIKNMNIFWENGLNNNVRVIDVNGNTKYFKECKRKLSLKEEVKRIINDYFDEYLSGKFVCDKPILFKVLLDEINFIKFTNSGFLWIGNPHYPNISREI